MRQTFEGCVSAFRVAYHTFQHHSDIMRASDVEVRRRSRMIDCSMSQCAFLPGKEHTTHVAQPNQSDRQHVSWTYTHHIPWTGKQEAVPPNHLTQLCLLILCARVRGSAYKGGVSCRTCKCPGLQGCHVQIAYHGCSVREASGKSVGYTPMPLKFWVANLLATHRSIWLAAQTH